MSFIAIICLLVAALSAASGLFMPTRSPESQPSPFASLPLAAAIVALLYAGLSDIVVTPLDIAISVLGYTAIFWLDRIFEDDNSQESSSPASSSSSKRTLSLSIGRSVCAFTDGFVIVLAFVESGPAAGFSAAAAVALHELPISISTASLVKDQKKLALMPAAAMMFGGAIGIALGAIFSSAQGILVALGAGMMLALAKGVTAELPRVRGKYAFSQAGAMVVGVLIMVLITGLFAASEPGCGSHEPANHSTTRPAHAQVSPSASKPNLPNLHTAPTVPSTPSTPVPMNPAPSPTCPNAGDLASRTNNLVATSEVLPGEGYGQVAARLLNNHGSKAQVWRLTTDIATLHGIDLNVTANPVDHPRQHLLSADSLHSLDSIDAGMYAILMHLPANCT